MPPDSRTSDSSPPGEVELALVRERLQRAAAGLVFESEMEAPFEYVELPPGTEPYDAPELAGLAVRERTPERFLRPHLEPDPEDAEAVERRERYRALLETVRETLEEPRVYRVGEGRVRYYLLGRAGGGRWAGLHTAALET